MRRAAECRPCWASLHHTSALSPRYVALRDLELIVTGRRALAPPAACLLAARRVNCSRARGGGPSGRAGPRRARLFARPPKPDAASLPPTVRGGLCWHLRNGPGSDFSRRAVRVLRNRAEFPGRLANCVRHACLAKRHRAWSDWLSLVRDYFCILVPCSPWLTRLQRISPSAARL